MVGGQKGTVCLVAGEEKTSDVGGVRLCQPVLGRGKGAGEQAREIVTMLLVEGAGEKEVGNVLGGGMTVGAVGGGACSFS